jgi:O-antigen/teichoic acid export membrane protein
MLDKLFQTIEKITPLKYRWILNHEGFKRYFANTGWMFFGQMFSLLVSFFIGAWLARYLGPENYGVLSYAVAFVGLFGFISSFGVDGVLSRELVRFPEQRDKLLGTAFGLKLFGGSLAIILAISSAFIFERNGLIRLLIILFTAPFILQSINVISTYFQAEVKSKNNVRALLSATLISSALKVLVIMLDKGVIWLIVVFALDALWQGIGFVIAYKRCGLKIMDWRFTKYFSGKILGESWPLMLASAAGFIYLRIDQVIIGALLGNYEVGIYAAAVKVVEVGYFVPVIICSSLFPAIINAKKIGEEFYHLRLRRFYLLMLGIPAIIAVPVTFFAKPIIIILFGPEYLPAVIVLQVYIWSSIGFFLGMAVSQYLLAENKSSFIFYINVFAMVVNIGLNLILIPTYGLLGAAFATFISYLVIPLSVFLSRRK